MNINWKSIINNIDMWYVRSWFKQNGGLVFVDEGPFDRYFAELVIADIGVDASIPRGVGRVQVEKASLISAEDM